MRPRGTCDSSNAQRCSLAPDSRWPDASAPPARSRMGGAVAQVLLVAPHVFVSEFVLMLWNKDDMMLHKFAQTCAASSRVIFRDESMQLAYVEVLRAKERLKMLNIDVCKLNLWRLGYDLDFRQSWYAMWRRRWWAKRWSGRSSSRTS